MTTTQIIEIALGALLVAGGIWLYRQPKGEDGYGSQGAVILFVVATLLLIHGLGWMEYRPSDAELGR